MGEGQYGMLVITVLTSDYTVTSGHGRRAVWDVGDNGVDVRLHGDKWTWVKGSMGCW